MESFEDAGGHSEFIAATEFCNLGCGGEVGGEADCFADVVEGVVGVGGLGFCPLGM